MCCRSAGARWSSIKAKHITRNVNILHSYIHTIWIGLAGSVTVYLHRWPFAKNGVLFIALNVSVGRLRRRMVQSSCSLTRPNTSIAPSCILWQRGAILSVLVWCRRFRFALFFSSFRSLSLSVSLSVFKVHNKDVVGVVTPRDSQLPQTADTVISRKHCTWRASRASRRPQ